MAWTTPANNRGRVDAAGAMLLNPRATDNEKEDALAIINNWRASHAYPLQSLKMTLLKRGKRVSDKAVVAQRLKRLSSIDQKLRRNNNMKLTQMQDIGGCRVVLPTVAHVDQLVGLYKQGQTKNPNDRAEFVKEYDYISSPKTDGYRSFHIVYKYRSKAEKNQVYNGLRIEVQIRSRLQHAWATAVETVSTFTGQALKSNIGNDEWKRFFVLMGSAIAAREKRRPVPGVPTATQDLVEELLNLERKLNIRTVLSSWGDVVQELTMSPTNADLYLLVLDSSARQVKVSPFRKSQLAMASEAYLDVEKRYEGNPDIQAVLVSVSSLASLRSAYPNYYLDTKAFLGALDFAADNRLRSR
ncbi:MAG: hypothetical protein MOGMAGMI_01460 [Candidatus Omnitrophica bacterium]|nr:hypothetical protein [Candidatus Omnitrophota bacterium]